MSEIFEEIRALCAAAHAAAPAFAVTDTETRHRALRAMATALRENAADILAANKEDLARAKENGVPDTMLDRLSLNDERINGMASAMEELIALPDPLAERETLHGSPKIRITKVRVPLGVVAIVFEARPNVTADAAAIAVKTGNAVVLRGGKEAIHSNLAIVSALKGAISALGLSPDLISLVSSTDRAGVDALLSMRGLIDVLIPRGGKGLIRHCVENAKVPVIETGAGVCHVYVDRDANEDMALAVAINAKCQRPSVCNAAETLLLHRDIAPSFLPRFWAATRNWNLVLRGCPASRRILPAVEPMPEEEYATEYNDYVMSVRVVDSVEEALAHIAKYGTHHSEAIITQNDDTAARFFGMVDAAAVYRNASTRFTDGGEFGLGAEIGISTQKLHARGPMGPAALTTVKFLVRGDGAVR